MTWVTDDGAHEGWVLPTFADGGLGGAWGAPPDGSTSRAVAVTRIGTRELEYADWQWRSPSEITGWVSGCSCRWRGTTWTRVATPDEHDPAAGRVYAEDGMADDQSQLEDRAHREWARHVAPDEALRVVSDLAGKQAEIGRQLDAAVAKSRALGKSWDAIGRAAGVSRQSAWERWRGTDVLVVDLDGRTAWTASSSALPDAMRDAAQARRVDEWPPAETER